MSLKDKLAQFEIPEEKLKSLRELPNSLQDQKIFILLLFSLIEDLSPALQEENLDQLYLSGDITSLSTISSEKKLTGKITAKEDGVIAGLPIAKALFRIVSPEIVFTTNVYDGELVSKGQIIAEVSGPGREILTAERPALNFLGRMSGIASLTRTFVDLVSHTNAVILDTRKTAPGFRKLDKYAVRMGGGKNHRMGLFDMALIKDNHIDSAGGIEAAVNGVRKKYGDQFPIEVEVKNLDELQIALRLDVERIMLDNMDNKTMKEAVAITHGRTDLEASGNVSIERIREIAETGVDLISIGALTHSAKVFDLSMRLL